jgi:hypothetical protein
MFLPLCDNNEGAAATLRVLSQAADSKGRTAAGAGSAMQLQLALLRRMETPETALFIEERERAVQELRNHIRSLSLKD